MKLSVFTFLVFLFSCNPDSLNILEHVGNNQLQNLKEIDLGFQNIQEGYLHNQLCNIIIANWSICSEDTASVNSEIKRILTTNCSTFVQGQNWNYNDFLSIVNSINFAEQAKMIQCINDNNYDFIDSLSLSPLLTTKIKGFASMMDTMDFEQSVVTTKNAVSNYYQENFNGLSANDITLFGSMIDVALNSIDFWSNSSFGGSNMFYYFENRRDEMCPKTVNIRWGGWYKVFLADALGVVSGATKSVIATGGLSALPDPLTGGIPPAGLYGLADGVVASCAAAL